MSEEIKEEVVAVEPVELGLRDRLESIDLTLPLAEISLADRKTALEVKTQSLLEKMKTVSGDTTLSQETKDMDVKAITETIQSLKTEFLEIGLESLKERRTLNLALLEQIIKMYTALIDYLENTDETKKADLLAEYVKYNNYTELDGTAASYLKATTDEEVMAFKVTLGDTWKSRLLLKIATAQNSISEYKKGALDVKDILSKITPESIIEKIEVLKNPSLFNFKKKTLAAFCKKKITDERFHKGIKSDDEYYGYVAALFRADAQVAITEEYVSDILDLRPTEGITTKAEYIASLIKDGTMDKITSVAVLYLSDYVQKAFADSTKTKYERFLYLSALTAVEAYSDFRISMLRAIYITPYIEELKA